MTKEELKWEIETKTRAAIAYAGYRYTFFFRWNIILAILSVASLWFSGYALNNNKEALSLFLNAMSSVLIILDVVINLKGCIGFWSMMYDGYNDVLTEYARISEKASIQDLMDLRSRLFDFDKKCKGTLNILLMISRNDACVQMGKNQCVVKIPLYKSIFKNVIPF